MLKVDSRVGSKDLVGPLRKIGLPAELAILDSADLAFTGRGPKGAAIDVGIEYKHLGELIGAMRSERLQGYQAPKMQEAFGVSYLLVVGEILVGIDGLLHKRIGPHKTAALPGRMSYTELRKRAHVLHLCRGINWLWVESVTQALKEIEVVYRVWTDVDQDQHKSHLAMYQAPPIIPVSMFRQRIVGLLKDTGVGYKTSKAVEEYFGGNIKRAVNANARAWSEVDGIGLATATKIVEVLDGRRE